MDPRLRIETTLQLIAVAIALPVAPRPVLPDGPRFMSPRGAESHSSSRVSLQTCGGYDYNALLCSNQRQKEADLFAVIGFLHALARLAHA